MTIGFDGKNIEITDDVAINLIANTTESNPNITDTNNDTNIDIILNHTGTGRLIATGQYESQTLANKTLRPRSVSSQKNEKNPHHWWCHICDCWNRCMIADHQQIWQWVQL